MENLYLKYFVEQFRKKEAPGPGSKGPVVTISREFGCPSRQIGILMTETLNKHSFATGNASTPRWKFINKEIIEHTARELKLRSSEVHYVLNAAEKGLFEDVLVSFTKPYVSNIRLKRTLHKVIMNLVSPGYIVVVGMGSAVILKGFPDALHIRLQAPLEWRAEMVRQKRNISTEAALELLQDMDHNRTRFLEFLFSRKLELSLFDVIFNCQRLSHEEIASTILVLMQLRKMI